MLLRGSFRPAPSVRCAVHQNSHCNVRLLPSRPVRSRPVRCTAHLNSHQDVRLLQSSRPVRSRPPRFASLRCTPEQQALCEMRLPVVPSGRCAKLRSTLEQQVNVRTARLPSGPAPSGPLRYSLCVCG